jgi:hypothetical protein
MYQALSAHALATILCDCLCVLYELGVLFEIVRMLLFSEDW